MEKREIQILNPENTPPPCTQSAPRLIDADTSRAITGVRFALMVLVVFIHNVITEVNFADGVVSVEILPAVDFLRHFISGVLGRIAVPLFFFISAYLAYGKDDAYPVLLKKKAKSLLVPYLLWNALIALAFFVCQKISALRPFFATTIIDELDWKGWLGLFVGRDSENQGVANALMPPLVYQFWFLRDLFLCSLATPLLKKAVQKIPLLTFFGVFLLLQSHLLYGGIRAALFWFTLGFFAARFALNWTTLCRIRFSDSILFFALTTTLDFIVHFLQIDAPANLNVLSILAGGILLLKISGTLCRNEKIFCALKWLSGFSFWLYATHDPFLLTPIKKLWTRFLPVDGAWMFTEYFGAVLLCICISLGAGILLKKLAPKVFALLTGSRGEIS